MKWRRIILVSAALIIEAGCASSLSGGTVWRERLQQVNVGMTRAAVEQLLPPTDRLPAPTMTLKTGGSQIHTYWLDPFWKVTMVYDYTGIQYDDSGKAIDTSLVNLHNKLLMAPRLIREDMPEPISEENIEQQDQLGF